jgi:hypothetical protein
MAKLSVPTKAVAYKKGKETLSKKAKYHLLKGGVALDGTQDAFTGCNILFWTYDFVKEIGLQEQLLYDIKDISELPADRLCKKCVGAMKLED